MAFIQSFFADTYLGFGSLPAELFTELRAYDRANQLIQKPKHLVQITKELSHLREYIDTINKFLYPIDTGSLSLTFVYYDISNFRWNVSRNILSYCYVES